MVLQTETFVRWLSALRNHEARARILARLRMRGMGHLGDVKAVGAGVFEMRLDVGPGYRLYFMRRGSDVILLLCGGTKGSQQRDLRRAWKLAHDVEEGA